jgi:dimeric dUTPase (all-alpha-NTP-PPase superfamily)
MNNINPENKCSHLLDTIKIPKEITAGQLSDVRRMFDMQLELQKFLSAKGRALNPETATYKQRIENITVQWRNLTTEFSELIERCPYKEWKTYPENVLNGDIPDEDRLEILFEYIDMFHFFMNIGLMLGVNGELFAKLYYVKNKENFDRQQRGY